MIQGNIESLENAAKKGFDLIKDKPVNNLYLKGFHDGIDWQKEQYKDFHAELLDKLKVAYDFMTEDVSDELLKKYNCDNVQWIFHSVKKTIEKGSIINK